MSTPVVCPYCSVRLRTSSMKAHMAICSRCPITKMNEKRISVEATRRDPSTVTSTSTENGIGPCVAGYIPSRSPSFSAAPAVLRLDLRSTSDKPTSNSMSVHNLWSYPKPKRRIHAHFRSSSIPSPPPDCGPGAQPSINDDFEDSETSSSFNTWIGEPNCNAQEGEPKITTVAAENCAASPLADSNVVERVSILEKLTVELRMALGVEKRARQELQKALESSMADNRANMSALRALVVDATKSAEAAIQGVKETENRLKNVPTLDEVNSLQERVKALLASSSLPQLQQRAPCETMYEGSSMNVPTGKFSNASLSIIGNSACSELGGSEPQGSRGESPFLHQDAGETVAQLLHLPPAAFIRVHNSNALTLTSASPAATRRGV